MAIKERSSKKSKDAKKEAEEAKKGAEEADKQDEGEDEQEEQEQDDEPVQKKEKRKKKSFKKQSKGIFTLDNLFWLVVFGCIMYYKGWHHLLYRTALKAVGNDPEQRLAAEKSLSEVTAGKPIDLVDLLGQLRFYCSRPESSSCATYMEKMPQVATSVKNGPGTWNRKPLRKEVSLELDRLVSDMSAVGKAPIADLRTIAKEVVSSTPKKLRSELRVNALLDS
mmetsp:Transcript_37879/g.108914  ORF Transcript_37879/g.108914 Transcript_37879/m.108914 type:complete len:223 (+) Transcript_37879:70-738(+)